jgi:HAD superfamily hydrolase (TIGR01490 family)
MTIAAFFDLDGTVLKVNSGALWAKREFGEGRIGFRQYLEAAAYMLAYRVRTIDMESVMRKALLTVKGEREEAVRRRIRKWYVDEVGSQVAEGARRVLRAHAKAGHMLVLLTTNSPYEAEAASEHLGMHAWISSVYETRDGVLTGEPTLPLCYGEGKVVLATRFAREHGVDLQRSFFYTDSASDMPMLRRVGNPNAVNPDPLLWLYARHRGWPVLDWRRAK